MQKTLCMLLISAMLLGLAPGVAAREPEEAAVDTAAAPSVEVQAPSAILMDAATGTVLFEKNASATMRFTSPKRGLVL